MKPFRAARTAWPLLLLLVLGAGCARAAAVDPPAPEPRTGWKEVDRLLGEQKLTAAAELVARLEAAARERSDDAELARALVRSTQIAIASGGFETAVEALRAKPWPAEPVARATVELYDAHALLAYLDAYGWEVAQRERVVAGGELDLRLWTRDQIVAEADRAFARVWALRERLGAIRRGEVELLRPNDYPEGIRPSLRDAVAYLWAGRLADSSHWSPAQLEETWKLDLAALIDGSPVEPTAERLAEPGLHPLVRMAAVLGDLERWHRSSGRTGAALEARLERLGVLHAAMTAEEDRQRIRAALAAALPEFRADPWWSMGMARLAAFWRESAEPDGLVRARQVALEGERAHPGSPGARACRRQREEIEAPAFTVQAMTVDGARRRSVEISHRNLDRLHFRAFRLAEPPFESQPVAYDGWSDERIRPVLRGEPAASWQVELPPTADFRDHRTFTTPPLEARGRYLVVASSSPGFSPRGGPQVQGGALQAVELRLGDVVLLRSWSPEAGRARLVVHALSGSSGRPLAGAEARLYRWEWERRPELVERRTTDENGLVAFAPAREERSGGGFAVLVRHGGEEAVWQQGYWPWQQARAPQSTRGTLVFTDRAIYRPGQQVLWKTLTWEGVRAQGRLRPAAGRAIQVRLIDPNGEAVATARAETNGFGTASGALEIPAGRPLGAWRLETDLDGGAPVAVEEYRRPTFEVELERPEREPRLNRPVEIAGRGRYYFGLPVASGRVAWRVVREPIWEWGWRSWWQPPAPPRTIASGTAIVGEDGRFHFAFTPEADERERQGCGCFRFRIEAELVDEGGETRSGSLALSLGWTAVRLVLPEQPFLVAFGTGRTGAAWRLRREDLDGQPRAGETSWRLVELAQPERAPLPADLPQPVEPARERWATEGDRLRPRWSESPANEEILAGWAERSTVARGELRHEESGEARLELPRLAPGAYRLLAETRDPHGETAKLEHAFVVAGDAPLPLAVPLELRFAKSKVPVGGTARLFVHSALPGQTILLEVVRGEDVRARRHLVGGERPIWIDLPVGEAERGGFGARAAIVADHQVVQRSAAVEVPWDDKQLELELSSFRDELEPGRTETFRVTVRGPGGAPLGAGAAELLASMYDRSLDYFRAHESPSVAGLYPTFGAPNGYQHELQGRGPVWAGGHTEPDWTEPPAFAVDALVAIDPYGIGGPGARGRRMTMMHGGAVEESMAAAMPAAQAADQAAKASPPITATGEAAPHVPPPPPPVTPRTDFSETAIWQPHLVTDAEGGAAIEFRVPESLTAWRFRVAAWTRELAAGSIEREVRTAKELMVRPYLPRFLREGDRAELRVVVQNAGERPLEGEVRLAVLDPETGADLSAELGLPQGGAAAQFAARPGLGDTLRFELRAPRGVRPLAVRVEARAGALADGEQRALPLLPSRLRLAQSRFAALRGGEPRELVFEDLARDDDPSRIDEQLVVTIDGQLFYGLLDALPYLVDYPYECTEQTLNRFVSTAVLGALFDRYPEVARVAEQLGRRETRWQRFDDPDPNRRTALEETPWLREARGGGAGDEGDENSPLLRVLDPRVARAVRADALAELTRAQLPSGAFPWFPGGPPSPHMTLYLLAGFARVAEFGGEIPAGLVERGWRYLAGEIERDWWRQAVERDCCWELLTFANYVASMYPDPAVMGDVLPPAKRREILDLSFRHWQQHAPISKLQLALTLARMDEPAKARLVLDSIFDSAKTDRDLGTFWAPEERSWLWYNDTLETHAWALRALSEIAPRDPRREGLVQWLFLQKKLGHWKSTRATAEVLYSVAHYLRSEERLAAPEAIGVTVGGRTTELRFEPGELTGRGRRIVLEGGEIVPARDSTVRVEPRTKALGFASATWHFSTERLPEAARGDLLAVERSWFRRVRSGTEATLVPLAEGERLAVGDELEIQLSIRARAAAEYVHLRDPRPAGLEPDRPESGWRWDLGLVRYEESRDSGTSFFFERLPAGQYTLRYRLRAAIAGEFRAGPAELQSMYAPEFTAYSAGARLAIVP